LGKADPAGDDEQLGTITVTIVTLRRREQREDQTEKRNKSKHYLFPIPSTELVLSHNLVQNPGW
jgi:hypothetical protein